MICFVNKTTYQKTTYCSLINTLLLTLFNDFTVLSAFVFYFTFAGKLGLAKLRKSVWLLTAV